MKTTLILKQSTLPRLLVALLLVTVTGCLAPIEVPPAEEEGEIQRIVEVKAEGLTLRYQRQSFWVEAKFSEMSENKAGFRADFKGVFELRLAQHGVSASGYSFSFDSATQSILVQCNIYDATSLSGSEYCTRFEWLEFPSGFDLLNFDKVSEDTLNGQCELDGISATFTLVFPNPIIRNCHYHVWW